MFGGSMGNPNPGRAAYICPICGVDRPPYQDHCDRHQDEFDRSGREPEQRPLLIDRLMGRFLRRGKHSR